MPFLRYLMSSLIRDLMRFSPGGKTLHRFWWWSLHKHLLSSPLTFICIFFKINWSQQIISWYCRMHSYTSATVAWSLQRQYWQMWKCAVSAQTIITRLTLKTVIVFFVTRRCVKARKRAQFILQIPATNRQQQYETSQRLQDHINSNTHYSVQYLSNNVQP